MDDIAKFFFAGMVVITAIGVGGMTVESYIEAHAPCREGKVPGYKSCPPGAKAELKDGDTWCRCPMMEKVTP